MDRIYTLPPTTEVGFGDLRVRRDDGFANVVLWKPDAATCAKIGDLEPSDWERFICLEAGQILEPVSLSPGESWTGKQTFLVL